MTGTLHFLARQNPAPATAPATTPAQLALPLPGLPESRIDPAEIVTAPRRPWLSRLSIWLVLVLALGIAAASAWWIGDLQQFADSRRQTQIAVADVERLASVLRYLEAETHEVGTIGLDIQTVPTLQALQGALDRLERLDHGGDVSFRIREAAEAYAQHWEAYFDLLAAGEVILGHRLVHERARPSWELFEESVAQAGVFYEAQASNATRRADRGTKITIAAEALLIAFLVFVLERIRRIDQKRLTDLAATSEAHFRSLVQNSSDVTEVVDAEGIVRYASDSITRVLGRTPEQAVGRSIFASLHPSDVEAARGRFAEVVARPGLVPTTELRIQRADGEWVWISITAANLLSDPHVRGVVLNFRDVSERKALEDELRHQALHDSLTRLPNRALFLDLLERALAESRRRRSSVAVCFLDLDGFKGVNDTLGHTAGDELLMQVADGLRGVLRTEDVAARFGGDEFAVLLKGADRATAEAVGLRILRAVRGPMRILGRPVSVGASVGIALTEDRSETPEALIHRADVAMYAAKTGGKGRYRFFEPGMEDEGDDEGAVRTMRSAEEELRSEPEYAAVGGGR